MINEIVYVYCWIGQLSTKSIRHNKNGISINDLHMKEQSGIVHFSKRDDDHTMINSILKTSS